MNIHDPVCWVTNERPRNKLLSPSAVLIVVFSPSIFAAASSPSIVPWLWCALLVMSSLRALTPRMIARCVLSIWCPIPSMPNIVLVEHHIISIRSSNSGVTFRIYRSVLSFLLKIWYTAKATALRCTFRVCGISPSIWKSRDLLGRSVRSPITKDSTSIRFVRNQHGCDDHLSTPLAFWSMLVHSPFGFRTQWMHIANYHESACLEWLHKILSFQIERK